jgi:hypothetical protein
VSTLPPFQAESRSPFICRENLITANGGFARDGPFDYARALVGAEKESFDATIQSYLRGEEDIAAVIADANASTSFAYNGDIMAHVSKGVFGIRAESVHRLCLEHTQMSDVVCSSLLTDADRLRVLKRRTRYVCSSLLTDADRLRVLKRRTRYAATLDPRALVCEAVACVKEVQL